MPEDVSAESSAAKEEKSSKPSAETLSTDEPDDKGTYVPRDRMNKAQDEAREAVERVEALQKKLDELEASRETTPPPGDEGSEEQVRHLVHKHASPLVDKKFAALEAELKSTQDRLEKSEESANRRIWQQMCKSAGADPNSKEIQGIVQGLSTTGDLTLEDALDRAVELTGGKKKLTETVKDVAQAETTGVSGLQTTSDWIPKDVKDAVAGAHKGKVAKHLSSVEILARRGQK